MGNLSAEAAHWVSIPDSWPPCAHNSLVQIFKRQFSHMVSFKSVYLLHHVLVFFIFPSYVITVCTCFSRSHPGGFHIIHQPLIPQLSCYHQNYTPMEQYQHISTIINSSIPSPSVESVEPFRGPRIKNAPSTRPL